MKHDSDTFILFEVAGTTYAVRSNFVQQIQMIERITPVPNAMDVIDGVVYARGQVIPALNLRARFGFERVSVDVRSRLVVVNVDGRVVGLVVDTAREFITLPAGTIESPPEGITGLSTQYLEGIATIKGRLILVLKLADVIDIGDATVSNGEKNEDSTSVRSGQ